MNLTYVLTDVLNISKIKQIEVYVSTSTLGTIIDIYEGGIITHTFSDMLQFQQCACLCKSMCHVVVSKS